MRIYLVSFLFFLMDTFRVTERRIVGRFCDARKRQKQKRVKEISSVNVSRNFFPLPFYLISGYMNLFFEIFLLFPSWNINELEQQECEEKIEIEMQMSRRNVGCRYGERERERQIRNKKERERERSHTDTGLNIWLNKIPSRFPPSLFAELREISSEYTRIHASIHE